MISEGYRNGEAYGIKSKNFIGKIHPSIVSNEDLPIDQRIKDKAPKNLGIGASEGKK